MSDAVSAAAVTQTVAAAPLEVGEVGTLLVAIAAIFLGRAVNGWLRFLGKANIPPAVTGGVLVAAALAVARALGCTAHLAGGSSAVLLPIFFITIGCGARLYAIAKGGVAALALGLAIVVAIAALAGAGAAVAVAFGQPAALGAFLGQLPYVGGHGTVAAWATAPQAEGLGDVLAIGLASATLGLVLGGLVAGPTATLLLRWARHDCANLMAAVAEPTRAIDRHPEWQPSDRWLATGMVILGCLLLGGLFVRLSGQVGFTMPGFLGALLAGVLATNLADAFRRPLDSDSLETVGAVALRIFLALALIRLDLVAVAQHLPLVGTAAVVQTAISVVVLAAIAFPLLGRDSSAAIATAGGLGMTLGSTAVGMAAMRRLEVSFGAAPKALLLVTLCASFVVDLANAAITAVFFIFAR
jgi:ESS family glutamate:Na+ symporter